MIELAHVFDMQITLAPPKEVGAIPTGNRRVIDITGGTFEGKRIRGTVLGGGADYQLIRADGSAFLDARYTLETDDGALIYVQNAGFRHGPPEVLAALARGDDVDPDSYYMRASATLETSAEQYDWVNRAIFLNTGKRLAAAVELNMYEVL
ncbi:MAG: DUF3237 domain-containing protein [Proteobacteria bacterium]|nr:DUF3237 domain-containing protein [Pseudomonadota bacterium]